MRQGAPVASQSVSRSMQHQQQPHQVQPKGQMGQVTQGMSSMQMRSEPVKSANAPPRVAPQQQQQHAPSNVSANRSNTGSGLSNARPMAAPPMQSNQAPPPPPSQIVYGSRPISGPFGQYNSMQYTIIGGSLAGSVVGGSHAGSVVGDSLTPSLVIGDWFGGDYV